LMLGGFACLLRRRSIAREEIKEEAKGV